MKKLLLILSLALIGCSADSIETETADLEVPVYYITIAQDCPSLTDKENIHCQKQEYERILNEWLEAGKPNCFRVEVDWYKPEPNTMVYRGYFAGYYGQ